MPSGFEKAPTPKDASPAMEKTLARFDSGEIAVNADIARKTIESMARFLEPAERERILASLTPREHSDESAVVSNSQTRTAENEHQESNTWELFENPALQEEIKALTPEERKIVDAFAHELVQDTYSFKILATKPLGTANAPRVDHVSFTVREDQAEQGERELLNKIYADVGRQVYENLFPDSSSAVSVAILNHPDDPEKTVLLGQLRNPGGSASLYKDERRSGQAFLCTVKNDSWILKFLRSGKSGRLFPFIYRNAAVEMNREALSYVDAPLSGADGLLGKAPNSLIILDVPRRVVTPFQDTRSADIAPFAKQAKNEAEFTNYASTYLGGANSPPDVGWPELTKKFRS